MVLRVGMMIEDYLRLIAACCLFGISWLISSGNGIGPVCGIILGTIAIGMGLTAFAGMLGRWCGTFVVDLRRRNKS